MKNKTIRALLSVLSVFIVMSTLFSSVPLKTFAAPGSAPSGTFVSLPDEARQAIANYALSAAENPVYQHTNLSQSGDNASFTSESILAAGVIMDTDSAGEKWYRYSDVGYSKAWSDPNILYQYFAQHAEGSSSGLSVSTVFSESGDAANPYKSTASGSFSAQPGDILFISNTSSNGANVTYSAVVTNSAGTLKGSGGIKFAAHNPGGEFGFYDETGLSVSVFDAAGFSESGTYLVNIYRVNGFYTGFGSGTREIRPDRYGSNTMYLQSEQTKAQMTAGTSYELQQRNYLLPVQLYRDYSGGDSLGYSTEVNHLLNSYAKYNEVNVAVLVASNPYHNVNLLKALYYGLYDRSQSYEDVNKKLNLSGDKKLQSNYEAAYVTQMGVWYASGGFQYVPSSGRISLKASDGSTYEVTANSGRSESDKQAGIRVLAAVKSLFDKVSNGEIPNKDALGLTLYKSALNDANILSNVITTFAKEVPPDNNSSDDKNNSSISNNSNNNNDSAGDNSSSGTVPDEGTVKPGPDSIEESTSPVDVTADNSEPEKKAHGALIINKKIKGRSGDVPPSSFEILYSDPNVIGPGIVPVGGKFVETGKDGILYVKDLEAGIYLVREIIPPSSMYAFKSLSYSSKSQETKSKINTAFVNVEAGEDVTLRFEGIEKQGVVVVNLSAPNSEEIISLEGAHFEIHDANTSELVETIATNEKGTAVSSKLLPLGEYTIKQSRTIEGYEKSEEIKTAAITAESEAYNLPASDMQGKDLTPGEIVASPITFEIMPIAGAAGELEEPSEEPENTGVMSATAILPKSAGTPITITLKINPGKINNIEYDNYKGSYYSLENAEFAIYEWVAGVQGSQAGVNKMTDSNGGLEFDNLDSDKDYVIKQISPSLGFDISADKVFELSAAPGTNEVKIDAVPQTCEIFFEKSSGSAAVPGAKFIVSRASDSISIDVACDTDGNGSVTMPFGAYDITVNNTSMGAYYEIAPLSSGNVTLTAPGDPKTVTYDIERKKETYYVVPKYDGNIIPSSDAQVASYKMTATSNDVATGLPVSVVGVFDIGTGKFKFNLPVGNTYQFEQVYAPRGYVRTADVVGNVAAAAGSSTDVVVNYSKQQGSIEVTRTGNGALLEGSKFEIYEYTGGGTPVHGTAVAAAVNDGDILGALKKTIITGSNGVAATAADLAPGTYIVKEIKVGEPEGYVKAPRYYVVLTADNSGNGLVSKVTIDTKLQQYTLTLELKPGDINGVSYSSYKNSNYSLKDAEFTIMKMSAGFPVMPPVIETALTDENGKAVFENLEIGDWVISHSKPSKGFYRYDNGAATSSEVMAINLSYEVSSSGEVIPKTYEFPVEPKKASISIDLYSDNITNVHHEPYYSVRNVTAGITNNKPANPYLGTWVSSEKILGGIVNGWQAITLVCSNLPLGEYTFEVTRDPVGYQYVAGKTLNVTFEEDNDPEQEESNLNQSHTIKLDPIETAKLTIRKTSKADYLDGEYYTLEDAEFTVDYILSDDSYLRYVKEPSEGTWSTEYNTFKTTAGGIIELNNIPFGEYRVKEIGSSAGHFVNEDNFDVELKYDTDNPALASKVVTVPETHQTGYITIKKIGEAVAESTKYFLPVIGAKYEIYNANQFSAAQLASGIEKADLDGATLKYSLIEINNDTTQEFSNIPRGEGKSEALPLGRYFIREVQAPNGYYLDIKIYEVDLRQEKDKTFAGRILELTEELQMREVLIIKRDIKTGDIPQGEAVLTDARFEIHLGSTVYSTFVTATGAPIITTDGKTAYKVLLPPGEYYINEVKPPLGYTTDTAVSGKKITIPYEDPDPVQKLDPIRFTVENKVITGTIAIQKYEDFILSPENDRWIPKSNVKFRVYLEKYADEVGKYKSGEIAVPPSDGYYEVVTGLTGLALLNDVPYGNYIVEEIADGLPKYIKVPDPQKVFINQDRMVKLVEFYNHFYIARLKVIKVDADTGAPIVRSSARFTIHDDTDDEDLFHTNIWGQYTDLFETDTDGQLYIPPTLMLLNHQYTLTEIEAPTGYMLWDDDKDNSVTVDFSDPDMLLQDIVVPEDTGRTEVVKAGPHDPNTIYQVNVTFKNRPIQAKVKLTKTGPVFAGIKEEKTVTVGKSSVTVVESEILKDQPLEGVTFDIVAAENIINPTGEKGYAKGEIVQSIETDNNGEAISSTLIFGKYVIRESATLPGYVLDTTEHSITVDDTVMSKADLTIDLGELSNSYRTTVIDIDKRMESLGSILLEKNPIEDVVFGIYTDEDIELANGDIIYADTCVDIIDYKNNYKSGVFHYEGDLPFGRYRLKELKTNVYYKKNTTSILLDSFEDKRDGTRYCLLQLTNSVIDALLTIVKTGEKLSGYSITADESYGTVHTPDYMVMPLAGAEFEIRTRERVEDFGDDKATIEAGGALPLELKTGSDGRAVAYLPGIANEYYIKETITPAGFVDFKDMITVEVNDKDELVSILIEENPYLLPMDPNGEYEESLIKKEIYIKNERKKPTVEVSKLLEPMDDADVKLPYKDIKFGIFAAENIPDPRNPVKTIIYRDTLIDVIEGINISNSNGEFKKTILNLPFGYTYYAKELTTNIAYVKDDVEYPFLFTNDTNIKVEKDTGVPVENKLKRGQISIRKLLEANNVQTVGVGIEFEIEGTTLLGTTYKRKLATNSDGDAIFSDIPLGTYLVTELKGAPGSANSVYKVSEPFEIYFDPGDHGAWRKQKTVINKLAVGQIELVKTWETPGMFMTGDFTPPFSRTLSATFNVTGTLTGESTVITKDPVTISASYSGGSGYVTNSATYDLQEGFYTFREMNADPAYKTPSPEVIDFRVDGDQPSVNVTNVLKKGSLLIYQEFEGTSELDVPIIKPGVRFRITCEQLNIFGMTYSYEINVVTDALGSIRLPNLLAGTYVIEEIRSSGDSGNVGYELSRPQTVIIGDGDTKVVNFLSKLLRNDLTIIKKNTNNDPLSNIMFEVYCKSTVSKISFPTYTTWPTDSNGRISLKIDFPDGLPYGEYIIRELEGPGNAGYKLCQEKTITVGANTPQTIDFINEPLKGDILIIKTFETGLVKPGVKFSITGTPIAQQQPAINGRIYETDNRGMISSLKGLPIGRYIITEVPCPANEGYVLAEPRPVDLGSNESVSVRIENRIAKGNLIIKKTFEDNSPIAGVPFLVECLDVNVESTVDQGGIDKEQFTGQYTTNSQGIIQIQNLPKGRYKVTELYCTQADAFRLAEPQIIEIETYRTTELEIENLLKRGTLIITKLFEERNSPMDGVPFRITGKTDSGMTINQVVRTNKEGKIIMDGLLAGDYTFEEEKSDITKGYITSPKKSVRVDAGATVEETVYNNLERTTLEITQIFKDRNEPIKNVPFRITGNLLIGTTYSKEFFTDENGKIYIENLLVGDYTITEVACDATLGYTTSSPVTITITAEKPGVVRIENESQLGTLRITKKFEGKEGSVEGIQFKIEGTSLTGVTYSRTYPTDSLGSIIVPDLRVGQYTIAEQESPLIDGYTLAPLQTVVITANKTTHVIIDNKLQRSSLKIVKTFEDGRKLEKVPFSVQGTPIAGPSYYETFYTKNDGTINIAGLPFGEYRVRELVSGVTSGYILADEVKVSIGENAAEVSIENKRQIGALKIVKKFENLLVPMAEVPFSITGSTTTQEDYSEIRRTDANGQILIPDLLVGQYVIQELYSDLTVAYEISGPQVAIIKPDQTTTVPIENKLVRGNVKVIKTDETYNQKHLTGALFEVYADSNGDQAFDARVDKLIGEMTEGEDGEYTYVNLAFGQYFVLEKRAPENYIRDTVAYPFKIVNVNETVVVDTMGFGKGFTNKRHMGTIKILNTSDDGGRSGISFQVVGDEFNSTRVTDKLGEIVLDNLRVGLYTVRELPGASTNGYKLADEIEVEVFADEVTRVRVHNSKNGTKISTGTNNPGNSSANNPGGSGNSSNSNGGGSGNNSGGLNNGGSSPQTNDSNNIMQWIIVLIIAAAGLTLILLISAKRRKKKTENMRK